MKSLKKKEQVEKAEIAPAPEDVVMAELEELVNQYAALQVEDQNSYDTAIAARAAIKAFIERVDYLYEEDRLEKYAVYKAVIAERDLRKKPAEAMLKNLSTRLGSFIAEQEKERKRLQAEQQLIEEKRAAADRKKQVTQAKKQGYDEESVQALQDAPLDVQHVEVDTGFRKSEFLTDKIVWHGRIKALILLIKFVAKNPHFVHLLLGNETEVNKLAVSQRDTFSIPGCEAFTTTQVADKRRR